MKKHFLGLLAISLLVVGSAFGQAKPVVKNTLQVHMVANLIGDGSGLGAGATTPALGMSQYTSETFNWTYTPNAPACTTTVAPTNCQSGFTITNVTDSVVIAAPGTSAGQLSPSTATFILTPAGGIPFGKKVFTIVANAYDGSGNALVSAPLTATVNIGLTTINAPTNFTETSN